MRIALTILFSIFIGAAMAAEPKYPVSAIPEDMKQGMYAVVRESDFRFYIESKSQSSFYLRKVITILNANAKDEATIAISYDKLRRIENFKANVYDAQGNLIKKLKQSDIIDQSAISGISLFEDNRVKYADLSQTTYPYTVEYEYTVNMRFLYSIPEFYLYVDDEISTQAESYSIIYPIEFKPRYRLFKIEQPKIATMTDKRESMTWTFTNTKPVKFEKLRARLDRIVPNIKVAPAEFEFEGYAGNMSTWEQYGKWQALLNQGRDVLPEPTKQKVRELTMNLKTTEEKTKVLYTYLQDKTRYVSIQLGIGGLQPFDATTVDQTGYGDCKALSNYMVAMLKEVGIKGYYTTIMAGDNAPAVTVDFPSHQSNHIIVAVPNNRDTLWLECTSQTNPFGYLGKFTGDRKALMITESGGKLVHTIRYSSSQNLQTRYAEVEVNRAGDAKAKVKTTYSGLQYENGGLDFIVNYQYDEQKKWIQKNTSIPNFDVTSFSMVDRKDKIPSATVKADLDLRRFATVSGKRIFITPNLMNRWSYIPEKVDTRRNPVVIKLPFIDIDTIRFKLPEGIYPEFMPQPVKLTSRFGEYEASFSLDQDNLVYIRKLKMNNGEFPAESYNELIEFYRNLNKADNTKMVFLSKT
jgi:transglutaminase-like putative cysteine protease